MLRKFLDGITKEQLTGLLPIPEEPLPSDCCGNGCRICVIDIYEKEVKEWIERAQRYLNDSKDGESSESKDSEGTMSKSSYKSKECLSKRTFAPFRIVSRVSISPDTYVFRFDVARPSSDSLLGILPGEHLVAKVESSEGEFVTRQYTPITDITVKDYFDVLIKIYPDGKFTERVKRWKVGDEILWKGPFGRFDHVANKYSHVVMIAGGTGIAPMISITQQILSNEDDETRIILLYSNKKAADILLKEKLDEFQDFWNFEVIYVLTKEVVDCPKLRYQDQRLLGRINRAFLNDVLSRFSSSSVRFLICGPPLFETDVSHDLVSLGFSNDIIVTF